MKRPLFSLFGLAASLVMLGCGGSSGGSSSETQSACDAYCNAYIGAVCPYSVYVSVADCESNECSPLTAAPAGCQTALTNWYDCRTGEIDICGDTGCDAQLSAVSTCN